MQLSDNVSVLKGVGPKKAESLADAGIESLQDLLYFFPRKYEDRRQVAAIGSLKPGTDVLISGKMLSRRYSGNPVQKEYALVASGRR